jgi:hypothetical protein
MLRPFSAAPLPFGSTGVSLRPCQLRAPDPRERIVLGRRLLFFASNFHAERSGRRFRPCLKASQPLRISPVRQICRILQRER